MARTRRPSVPLDPPTKTLCLHGRKVRPGGTLQLLADGWLAVLMAAGQPAPGWCVVRCHGDIWDVRVRDLARHFRAR